MCLCQILRDKGETKTRHGCAEAGIAVVEDQLPAHLHFDLRLTLPLQFPGVKPPGRLAQADAIVRLEIGLDGRIASEALMRLAAHFHLGR